MKLNKLFLVFSMTILSFCLLSITSISVNATTNVYAQAETGNSVKVAKSVETKKEKDAKVKPKGLFSKIRRSSLLKEPTVVLGCEYLHIIKQKYINEHINYSSLNSTLEARTIDQFVKQLDRSKIYLLASDIKKMKRKLAGVFSAVKRRDCSKIKEVHDMYKKRVAQRVDYARKTITKKFKFNKKTELVLDPEHRKFPVSISQANKFHNKYLQFQISNYIATDMKLPEAKERIVRNYERIQRRAKDFSEEDLYVLYMDSFANALDPHSSFFSRDAIEDFEIQMKLSLEGIGATLSSRDGLTVIEQLIAGGAAFKSRKLKAKDKIVAVAQGNDKFVDVIEKELRDVVRLIRGKKGTMVRLRIVRKEGKKSSKFIVNLIRDKIKLEDEAAGIDYFDRTINGKKMKVGLINLPSFYADSRRNGRSAAKDMKRILAEARSKNVQSILLDLSTNGGGSLDDAVKISGLFFKTGNVVKQSQKDPGKDNIELADTDEQVDWNGPLVILISRISASASEIVSSTLQDYKRAVVVGGDHSFGKGTVQSVSYLPRKLGALKTTVGMFFTAGGYSTQHRGVNSNIVFPSIYSTEDIGEKTLDYSLPPKKVPSFLSKEAYVNTGKSRWFTLKESVVKELGKNSKDRIAKNKDFKKIVEDMKKSKAKSKVIKISEILEPDTDKEKEKDKDKDKDKVLTKAEKKAKYLKRADIQEALNISFDLAIMNSQTGYVAGATKIKAKATAN